MHSRIGTVEFRGIETINLEVQVHITIGVPSMAIAGLMDDIGENDPSDMALDFGKCLSTDAAELLRLALENDSFQPGAFTR